MRSFPCSKRRACACRAAQPGAEGTEGTEEQLLPSYPVAHVSPWHTEHVEVLEQAMPGFRNYAMAVRCTI